MLVFKHEDEMSVSELIDMIDIIATNNVLFISENKNKLIHRVQLPEERITNWSVNSNWLTLSVTKKTTSGKHTMQVKITRQMLSNEPGARNKYNIVSYGMEWI